MKPVNFSWCASVISAALAFQLGGFILFLAQLPVYQDWGRLAEGLYIDSLQALAFLAFGVVCRILSLGLLRSKVSAPRVVLADLAVIVLAIAAVAAVAIPLDSSGAALFSIFFWVVWGIPGAVVLSGLSLAVERYSWLRILLIVVLVVNAALLLLGLAFQIAV